VLFARRDNLGFLRERNYSMKMASYRAPGFNLFVVNEPKLARSILIADWERFPKATLLRQSLHPAIGSGVLGSVGEEWKRQRRMIDPGAGPARHGGAVPAHGGRRRCHAGALRNHSLRAPTSTSTWR
jgi:cytochrome P450